MTEKREFKISVNSYLYVDIPTHIYIFSRGLYNRIKSLFLFFCGEESNFYSSLSEKEMKLAKFLN